MDTGLVRILVSSELAEKGHYVCRNYLGGATHGRFYIDILRGS